MWVPLLEEGAAGVLDVLQLEEAGADQERLDVLLVDGYVSVIGEINKRFQSTRGRQSRISTSAGTYILI